MKSRLRLRSITSPRVGKRGALSRTGCATIVCPDESVVWIEFNSPRGWNPSQEAAFKEVTELLSREFQREAE